MLTAMEIFINVGMGESKAKRIESAFGCALNLFKVVKSPKINMLAVL